MDKASDPEIVQALNRILSNRLAGISQYFLHARILKHQGFLKLADRKYKESIDEMRHADQLVERVLALGGFPALSASSPAVGASAEEILESDLRHERRGREELASAIALCNGKDGAAAALLKHIGKNGEERIAFLESELTRLSTLGINAYRKEQA